MADNCLIAKTKKRRVAGNNGPRRNQLTEYGIIATDVPQEVLDEIMSIATTYETNDLRGDNYQISQHCNVDDAFTSSLSYKQILLQQLADNTNDEIDEVDETNYTKWRDDLHCPNVQKYLETKFIKPYRTRISVMPPGNDLNWHIDTDTSVLCRAQIPVVTQGSKFQWKTKQGQSEVEMTTGNVYFVNTGWLHRVVNESENVRIVLIFGVDYDNIPDKQAITL